MTECPVEAVFGPDDRVPCLLERGHDGPHQYTPEACGQCDCLPRDPRCGGCINPRCPCADSEADPFGPSRWLGGAWPA